MLTLGVKAFELLTGRRGVSALEGKEKVRSSRIAFGFHLSLLSAAAVLQQM